MLSQVGAYPQSSETNFALDNLETMKQDYDIQNQGNNLKRQMSSGMRRHSKFQETNKTHHYVKAIKQSRTMGHSTPQYIFQTPTNSQIVPYMTSELNLDGTDRSHLIFGPSNNPKTEDKMLAESQAKITTSGLLVCQPSSMSSVVADGAKHDASNNNQLESTSNMADVIKAHHKMNQQVALPPKTSTKRPNNRSKPPVTNELLP